MKWYENDEHENQCEMEKYLSGFPELGATLMSLSFGHILR